MLHKAAGVAPRDPSVSGGGPESRIAEVISTSGTTTPIGTGPDVDAVGRVWNLT